MNYLNEILEENNFTIIEENTNEIKISYEFDLVEIDAAKSFATEEEGDFDIVFIAYLKDIAYDNLLDVVDEIEDEYDEHFYIKPLNYEEKRWVFSLNK